MQRGYIRCRRTCSFLHTVSAAAMHGVIADLIYLHIVKTKFLEIEGFRILDLT
jgi:hypothetical protein